MTMLFILVYNAFKLGKLYRSLYELKETWELNWESWLSFNIWSCSHFFPVLWFWKCIIRTVWGKLVPVFLCSGHWWRDFALNGEDKSFSGPWMELSSLNRLGVIPDYTPREIKALLRDPLHSFIALVKNPLTAVTRSGFVRSNCTCGSWLYGFSNI